MLHQLILSEWRDWTLFWLEKKSLASKAVVSEIFKDVAVELVGSTFAYGYHLAAHGQSILSLESAATIFKTP